MTFMDCFMFIAPWVMGICVAFGVLYPAVMVGMYKLCGSKLTICEILKRI